MDAVADGQTGATARLLHEPNEVAREPEEVSVRDPLGPQLQPRGTRGDELPGEGESGLRGWYEVFEKVTLDQLSVAEREAVLAAAERNLRSTLRRETPEGPHWTADYVRLRVVARRA